MVRWACAAVTALVLTGLAFLLLTGQYLHDGQVVVEVTRKHGVHQGDLFVVAGWAVAMVCLLVLAVMPARRRATAGASAESRGTRPHATM
jgi:hypothetical protein